MPSLGFARGDSYLPDETHCFADAVRKARRVTIVGHDPRLGAVGADAVANGVAVVVDRAKAPVGQCLRGDEGAKSGKHSSQVKRSRAVGR